MMEKEYGHFENILATRNIEHFRPLVNKKMLEIGEWYDTLNQMTQDGWMGGWEGGR